MKNEKIFSEKSSCDIILNSIYNKRFHRIIQTPEKVVLVTMSSLALAITFSIFLGSYSLDVIAAERWTYNANLSGSKEVPAVSTSASGAADFRITDNNTILRYRVNLTGIANVTGAHIQLGNKSQNGYTVVDLFQIGFSKHKKTTYGRIVRGNITDHTLKGPLKGKRLTDLISAINIGNAYVNINSRSQPKGEIRGQLIPNNPASLNIRDVS